MIKRSINFFKKNNNGSKLNKNLPTSADHDESIIRASELFDVNWYISQNLDIDFSSIDPVIHYLKEGVRQGQWPHPLFDPSWYFRQVPELQDNGINPLVHCLKAEQPFADPHPLFDCRWYLDQNEDVRASGQNALEHFVRYGAWEGRNPHPLFDIHWYARHNAEFSANPLLHYIAGHGENPHPLFDETYYRCAIKDIDYENEPLLLHFIKRGADAGYNPNPYFDCAWYVGNHETLQESGENPLAHFVRAGVMEDRDPHPLFDLDWYLYRNPEVMQSGMNPLSHFLSSGIQQGRQCHPPAVQDLSCAVLEIPYEIRRTPVISKDRDVCVFVTYSHDGEIFPHIRIYLEALQADDIDVILTVVTDGLNRKLPEFTETVAGLVVRINHGWDFAAWAAVLTAIPGVWSARSLILTNDSIFGPTDAGVFRNVIRGVRASTADVIALTDSYQGHHHLMSYFTVIKNKALKSKHVHQFWNDIRSLRDKNAVINHYEMSSMRLITQAGLASEVLFPTKRRSDRNINPTLADWRGLIQRGFPFVKVQLLRDLDRLAYSDTKGWREVLTENRPLLEAVDTYLAAPDARGRGDAKTRPVPGPRRRFRRTPQLATFYGMTQSSRPSDLTDLCLEVPFRAPVGAADLPNKVAVLVHIFYAELCDEIRAALVNIPVRADLFISTDTQSKKIQIERCFAGFGSNVTVTVFPNIGRDVAPMIIGYANVFEDYEFFLHIHSKNLLHTARFSECNSVLTRNLLGSREIVASILVLLTKTDVGIVFSDQFNPIRSIINWGSNFDRIRSLMVRIGVSVSKDLVLEFPSTSFFWGRSAAIRPLLALKLDWSDFEAETGQIDGTLVHAIERMILYVAEASSFSWAKVAQVDAVAMNRLVPVWNLEDVARSQQQLLGNRLPPLADRGLIPELVSFCSRPDRRSTRPRFNLVIPALKPEFVFDGITTALRIFDEIAAALGPDHDFRIICQSLPLDLHAMVMFTDYCLVPMGTKDDFQRTIVDLSEQESGEVSVRANDVFLATAWWTACVAFDFQKRQKAYFGRAPRVLYLIQDHEPDFYGWSTQYSLAQETYRHRSDMMAIITSEELSAFMTASYPIDDAYLVRFKINPKIVASIKPMPRERIVCIYARPGTPQNAFSMLCAGIAQWQRNNPRAAHIWRVVAVGETFSPERAGSIANLSVAGKLSLEDYGNLLSRASVGISLMLSPHPSYPPLEMAAAGIRTITNSFASKDLSRRSDNILSIDNLTADALADALDEAIFQAEDRIGKLVEVSEIKELPSAVSDFDASRIASSIRAMCTPST